MDPPQLDVWTTYQDAAGDIREQLPSTPIDPERVAALLFGEADPGPLLALAQHHTRAGVPLLAWQTTITALIEALIPRLVQRFMGEPPRRIAALGWLQRGTSDRMARIIDAYVAWHDERLRTAASDRDLAQRRFQTLSESGLIGIIIIRLDSTVVEINDALLAMLGLTREEVLSGAVEWRSLTPPGYEAIDGNAVKELRERGVAHLRQKEYVHKSGRRVPVLVGSALTHTASGEVVSFVMDQSERKRVDEQLRQAQKMEAVGRLAGGIAHDFNNLLSVLLTYAELVEGQLPEESPLRADMVEIRRAGLRASELTQQLLAFSRKQMLQPRVVAPNDLLTRAAKLLQRLIGEHIEMSLVLEPGAWSVFVDPAQLEQILMNLVLNSRDAMPEGGKVVIETRNVTLDADYAATHAEVVPGPHVLLAVSDTGVGMDAETRAHVFEPFYTTKELGKGTGLGLATVFGIVKQSGGHVWLYSEPGRGTTFKIYFPRAGGDLPSDLGDAVPARGGHETILLVEDDPQVRALSTRILARGGYTVLVAADGPAAIDLARAHTGPIHLLVTDVVMPRMSGTQVANALAQLRSDCKVLYVSGYTENSVVHHGVVDAGVAFLPKPITPESLLRKVREVLG